MSDSENLQRMGRKLYEKFKHIAEDLSIVSRNRWVRLVLQLLVITFSILYLVRNFQSIDLSELDIRLNYSGIGWSFVATLVALLFGGIGWWLTLISVGHKVGVIEAVRIHLVSNLAKYIPGYAWQLLSKGYLTRKTGAPGVMIGLSMTLELAQIFFTGIWLIILFFPEELSHSITTFEELGENIIFLKIVLLGILAFIPLLLPALIKRFNPLAARIQISTYPLILSILSILAGWVLFGFAFWLLGNAVQPITSNTIPIFIFTLAVSFLGGLLIIIIPASIGVRESLMVFFLSFILSAPIAVIVASLSRVVLTLCELFTAGSIVLYARITRN